MVSDMTLRAHKSVSPGQCKHQKPSKGIPRLFATNFYLIFLEAEGLMALWISSGFYNHNLLYL